MDQGIGLREVGCEAMHISHHRMAVVFKQAPGQ